MKKPLSVMWLGLRGFPNVEGGVETHAQQICTLLSEMGCDMHVFTRSSYQSKTIGKAWHGVRFHNFWVPRLQGFEALIHTFFGVMYARFITHPDILHIQSIGPAIMTPLARLLGLKVVVTHHGPDYDRQKWGYFAKLILHLGERFGMRWAHKRIVISNITRKIVEDSYALPSILIPNGVPVFELPDTQGILEKYSLLPERYVLLVSRLVPEKRHLDLIKAFQQATLSGWKLVIVGTIDASKPYTKEILSIAAKTPNVICTGFLTGLPLSEIYTHAGMFVLPSSHEGLSITVLEALSYGLPVIASNIPANLEIGLSQKHYFPLGSHMALSAKIREFAATPIVNEDREERRCWVQQRYDWMDISRSTLAVYLSIL